MSEATFSFVIDTEVTSTYLGDLLDFIHRHYILPRQDHFTNVTRTTVNDVQVLTFTAIEPKGKWHINVEVRAGKPILVRMSPSDETVPKAALDVLREDLIIGVQLFEERVRKTTLYFAWVEGEKVVPESAPLMRRKALRRMLTESMLLLFVLFFGLSIFLFMILGNYTPIVLVALQFIVVLNADKLIARMGEWSIGPKKPKVHLLQYHLPVEDYQEFRRKYTSDQLIKIKQEIYERTLAVGREIDCETAREVLLHHGFECKPENMSTKTINIYQIVKNAAERFRLPLPKIVVSNTMLPNAAASGPSPKRGVVLVTTGLFIQLEEDEILSVVGHELSHLKGRDPLILFALTTSEYLLRWYLIVSGSFFSVIFWFPYLSFLYFIVVIGGIYFVAKFFEARADLESSIIIGQPKVLAEALRKIGFRKLQYERMSAYRFQDWIGWDPHPPVYFRIARLEKLQTPVEVKHVLIQSVKDVINGFLAVLR